MPPLSAKRIQYVNDQAFRLFHDDPYMRIAHYGRSATIDGRGNPLYSPKIITPLILGHAGYGKTSQVRQYARDLGIGFIERKLGGITDIAEVFGMVDTDKVSGYIKTVHCAPSWWPDPDNDPNCPPEGIILWDDANRCLPHILNGVMPVWIDEEINGLPIPEGWTMICTGNPDDGYNVTSMDAAQQSRLLTVAYNRPNEVFFRQLEAQDVHDDLKNVWMNTAEDTVTPPKLEVPKPTNNDRLKMIFSRVYPYLENDEAALMIVARSMFDNKFLVALNAMRQADKPLRPEDVLYNWTAVADTAKRYIAERRTDLINTTVVRLVTHIASSEPDKLKETPAYKNLAAFGDLLPPSEGQHLIAKLQSLHTDHGRHLKIACIDVKSDFAKKVADTKDRIDRKMAARSKAI